MKHKLLFIISGIVLFACSQNDHKDLSHGNKFDDQVIREIYTLQDLRDTETLINFLKQQDADYRREAAAALGSVQDSTSILPLINLLHDEFVDVRLAAVYSLGQIKNPAAEEGILNALDDEKVPLVMRELWEALGKCSTSTGINFLVTHNSQDSLEKEGMAWALYQIGLRGLANEETTSKAGSLLDFSNLYSTRLGASHYFSRTRNIDISNLEEKVAKSALQDMSPFVRMSSARALSKASDSIRTSTLHAIIRDEPDPRVIINAINALAGVEADKEVIEKCLKHNNVNVVVAAGDFISRNIALFESQLIELIDITNNWRAKATLIGAAISTTDLQDQSNAAAIEAYRKSTNNYEKAALLTALGKNSKNHSLLWTEIENSSNKAMATAGISALASIRGSADYDISLDETFINYFRNAILTGDQALVAIASGALRNPDYGYKSKINDYSFLSVAKEKLTLPMDNETLQSLERTIAYFQSRESPPVINEYNHPINWEIVKSISNGQRAVITTTKGKIVIELLVNESPGSVDNFYSLANSHYYDGKVFHRVVPNFVIQGGCPRGDGFGGEDYSIRSELGPLRYKEGSLGMASAGKDTEGVQWFITHSPTPHLDGSYSIFGQVIEGMNVVNAIEVGDVIEKIEFPSIDE
jgi:cyclophilin family peptidyl-prolyl cis-trans isomerase/HEAT repeat protein